MSATKRVRFAPSGPAALEPRAFGLMFDAQAERPQVPVVSGVAIVDVRGPLMHHKSWWCESYDGILETVREALEQSPRAVLLRIDSPGGMVSGMFETATAMRDACAAAGVELHAYVDGQATSAAYALACAGETISAPATAVVGSIGVIDALVDARANDAMYGMSVTLVASGARKTDGNPHSEATPDAIAATQRNVDALAQLFFSYVGARRGMEPDAIAGLQASVLIGAAALGAGLVDRIATFDETLAAVAGGGITQTDDVADEEEEETDMDPKDKKTPVPAASAAPVAEAPAATAGASKKYDEAIATLRKLASGDSDEAKKAKRMLKAELDDDETDDGDQTDDGGGDDKEKDGADGTAAEALRVARAAEATATNGERQRLLDSRPDLDEATRTALASAPLETVRALIKSLPKVAARPRAQDAAAATTPGATRGATQVDGEFRQTPEAKAAMDRIMGLTPTRRGAAFDGTTLRLGVALPVEAPAPAGAAK